MKVESVVSTALAAASGLPAFVVLAVQTASRQLADAGASGSFTLYDPLTQSGVFCSLKGFLAGAYTLGTLIALLWLVIAGFRVVGARGNPTALSNARTNLWRVLAGVAIFMGSWLIATAIFNTISLIFPGIFTGIGGSC